ncbi:MAG TPA: ATPase [Eubacteriaceae bacterium]|nr:ATPase [Eubacteriaceae bacterium]
MDRKPTIAVLSGKGGTGKTLISVNLAASMHKASYIDCDIEEPNGRLFLKSDSPTVEEITVEIPEVDPNLCDGCRICVDFCQFNALAYLKDHLKVFDDICHSCGGCFLLCPQKALQKKEKPIGVIESGYAQGISVKTGVLNPGEATGIPIIESLLKSVDESDRTTIIDCPPGSACSVMESIKDADYCLLVTEPTRFGAHNLKMIHELVQLFGKPCSVIINKSLGEENPALDYCIQNNLAVMETIPYDKELAKINSNGVIAYQTLDRYRQLFDKIGNQLLKEVSQHETTARS